MLEVEKGREGKVTEVQERMKENMAEERRACQVRAGAGRWTLVPISSD